MILSKHEKEKLIRSYIDQRHSQDACIGFIDGIEATLKLLSKLQPCSKNKNTTTLGKSHDAWNWNDDWGF